MNKTIYLAGGCFWGMQKYFDRFEWAVDTTVGYANGPDRAPTYEEVCADSGHAETIRLVYDDERVSLTEILDHFFLAVDPLSVNRQGEDSGIQYRSGIYYTDDDQREEIEKRAKEESRKLGAPLATQILPLSNFFEAEEYHQKYLEKNPGGYCHIKI